MRVLAKQFNISSSDGTHLNLRKNVLPGECSNGFVTVSWSCQSDVRQMRTVRSSDCVARNSPTGSQQTPFTKPWWRSSFASRSVQGDNEWVTCGRNSTQKIPSLYPHQMMTCESSPVEARYRSSGDHARSVTSFRERGDKVRR